VCAQCTARLPFLAAYATAAAVPAADTTAAPVAGKRTAAERCCMPVAPAAPAAALLLDSRWRERLCGCGACVQMYAAAGAGHLAAPERCWEDVAVAPAAAAAAPAGQLPDTLRAGHGDTAAGHVQLVEAARGAQGLRAVLGGLLDQVCKQVQAQGRSVVTGADMAPLLEQVKRLRRQQGE
jgi:hypothetical protein